MRLSTRHTTAMTTPKRDWVLFDPVSWIHPHHFVLSARFNTPRCRSILNSVLIKQFALPVDEFHPSHLDRYFIEHWSLLPKAAFMIACSKQRARLAFAGQWTQLPSHVQQFARLSLTESHDTTLARLDETTLWRLALNELLLFQSRLSAAVLHRLPLLFPIIYQRDEDIQVSSIANALLLRLALQHAKYD